MRQFSDIQAKHDGHIGRRHPRRHFDIENAHDPLPHAAARPRGLRPWLMRQHEDRHHHRKHGNGREKDFEPSP